MRNYGILWGFIRRTWKVSTNFFKVSTYFRKHEAEVARQHTKALEQQLTRIEQGKHKGYEESKLTQENINKKFKERDSQRKISSDNEDNFSSASFKSANTGFTGGTGIESQAKISKEDIIYQKYV